MKNIILGVVLPLLLVASGLGLLFGLQKPEPARTRLPNPNDNAELLGFLPIAEVAEVKLLADPLNLEVSGTVVPYRELGLAAEVAGRIIEKDVNARSGHYVTKGQVLYRIDPRDYDLEIERLSRKRDQELAAVSELQQDIDNSFELLKVAEQELELAEMEVKRFERMQANFSSAAELDQAKRARLSSMNQRVTIQNQLRTYEARRTRLELAAKLAETELEQAELDLERTVIRAPVDGRVVSEGVEIDSFVQRGTPLLVIEDTEKVEIAANIRMDQLSWILEQPNLSADRIVNAAQVARFNLPASPVEVRYMIVGRESHTFEWQGVLDRLDGSGLDPQSRTVPLRIRVDNPRDFKTAEGQQIDASGTPMLVRGMFVEVVIKATPTTRLLLVPKLGIKPASSSSVIWKFSPNPEAIRQTSKALEAMAAYEKAVRDGNVESLYPSEAARSRMVEDSSDEDENSGMGSKPIDPLAWQAGNLQIVEDVRLVTAYWNRGPVDYWVCEVPAGSLDAGDKVIISPLPGVRSDGTDPVRIRRSDAPATETDWAGKSVTDGRS